MKRNCIGVLLAAMLSMPVVTYGQGRMTLRQLYALAEEHGTGIKAARADVEAARHACEDAKAQRLPDITSTLGVGWLSDGLLGDRNFASWQHIDNPHLTNNFALRAKQVIYAGGAVSSGIAMARLAEEKAQLGLSASRQELLFAVTSHYLDLCRLQNSMTVVEKNIQQTLLVIDNMRARHAQGTALRADITRFELQLESLRLRQRKIADAKGIVVHQLAVMLHLPEDISIEADYESVRESADIGSESDWQAIAAANSMELKRADVDVRMQQNSVRMQRSELLPKVAVVAEEYLDGPITIEVPVVDKNFNYWCVGVSVSYNISSLFKSNRKVRQAKARLREYGERHNMAREEVNMAIQAAYTDYLTAYSELDTQRKSVELADECYRVTENRYRNGLALLADMLDASNAKLSAELALVEADINILYNYFKLRYISNTL